MSVVLDTDESKTRLGKKEENVKTIIIFVRIEKNLLSFNAKLTFKFLRVTNEINYRVSTTIIKISVP